MDVSDLAREVRELRERLDDWSGPDTHRPSSEKFQGNFPKVEIVKDPAKKNYKLKPKKFPIYNGDRATYPAWRTAILSSLRIDWNTLIMTILMYFNDLQRSGGKGSKGSSVIF